jgi:hypothetical protein
MKTVTPTDEYHHNLGIKNTHCNPPPPKSIAFSMIFELIVKVEKWFLPANGLTWGKMKMNSTFSEIVPTSLCRYSEHPNYQKSAKMYQLS